MKLNWGTGITIAIIAFMGFILFMVFKATTTKSDLFAENYYEQEINYQSKINALQNAEKLEGEIIITQERQQLIVQYPVDFEGESISGQIHFFKPDNAALDKIVDINVNDNKQSFSKSELVAGTYNLKINWQFNGIEYLVEKQVQIN